MVYDGGIIAGTEDYGLFYSTDEGVQWNDVNKSLGGTSIRNILFVGNDMFLASWGSGIFISSDKGQTFKNIDSGLTTYRIECLAALNNRIFATGNGSIFMSTDKGHYWAEIYQEYSGNYIYSFLVDNGVIYAGSNNGLIVSYDNGSTWGFKGGDFKKKVKAMAKHGNNFVALTDTNGVFISKDGGTTFSEVTGGKVKYDLGSIVTVRSNIFVASKQRGMYFSPDSGVTWKAINDGLENRSIYSIMVNGNDIYIGTFFGTIYKAKVSDFSGENGGYDEISEIQDISISPNPATDYIEISYPGFDRMVNHTVDEANFTLKGIVQLHVEIFNVYGEKVLTTRGYYSATLPYQGGDKMRIDVSGLSPSIYFIKVGEKVGKFVKY